MKKLALILSACLMSTLAHSQVFPTFTRIIRCEALGTNVFRQTGLSKEVAFLTNSIMTFQLGPIGQGQIAQIVKAKGHVSVQLVYKDAFYTSPQDVIDFTYIGLFDMKTINSVMSRNALTYPDNLYYRFPNIVAQRTNTHDGGGMAGYLVIHRSSMRVSPHPFDAHYVFKAGDHAGGTIDYTCRAMTTPPR